MMRESGPQDSPGNRESPAGRLYRSVASDTVPPHLDEAVLKEAASEVGRDAWFKEFIPWMRPAAFAATFALCLALLFELDDPWETDGGVAPGLPAVAESPDVVEDFAAAATDSSARVRAIGARAREQAQAPDPVPTVTTPRAAAERYCDDEDSATAETWWACIEALRQAGRAAEAEAELELLQEAYPNFVPERR